MKSEFVMAINQICSERNLPQEVILEAIESALVSAYKRNYGGAQNIKAEIDPGTGAPQVFVERIVVEQVEDDRFEITLKEARKTAPEAELGMLVKTDVTPKSFGRIAAQTAKQVILQRIREAERDALFSSYIDREGELINGMVANITAQAVTLNLGRTEAIMPRSQQVPRERYRIGQRVRAYVMEVRKSSRGPQIFVSRTHRHMLRRLLELEVPEIFNGTVEIKAIAREAGSRSKVAVTALQEGVDPVGSCVGMRGMRIQSIVNELGGEKIDVVEWSPDTATFIANALSPAKVNYTMLGDESADSRTATVIVPDDQLSLAIGKEGQNARLAAKLTGWRIDIKNQREAASEDVRPGRQAATAPAHERDILAMAEAILLGKETAPSPRVSEPEQEVAQAEQEPAEAPLAESPEELGEDERSILTVADALLHEEEATSVAKEETQAQEPVLALEEQAEPEAELQASQEILPEEEAVLEPELPSAQEPELELPAAEEPEPEPPVAEEPQPAPAPQKAVRKTRYEFVEDESLEVLTTSQKKTDPRRRRRDLVLDEESGHVISRRRHKRGGTTDEYEWEDNDY